VFFAFVVVVVVHTASVFAHAIGLSSAEYVARERSLFVTATFARREVALLVPTLDADRDGHITAIEVKRGEGDLTRRVFEHIVVTGNGATCSAVLTDAALTDTDGFSMSARYDCPTRTSVFTVIVRFLDELPDHRHRVRAIGATTADVILTKGDATFTVTVPDDGASTSFSASPPAFKSPRGAFAFVAMGIEHIFEGYDHLLFLFGLALATARVRDLFSIVTAFTVGHSLTLALAAFGLMPSAFFVEPMIALSIAYVGVENLFMPDAATRWRITLPFGLVHGFGFAGVLRSVALERAEIPAALVAFNVGIEVGQAVIMVFLMTLLVIARHKAWLAERGVRTLSFLVAATGVVWFALRLACG
jgi:hypothetical protein